MNTKPLVWFAATSLVLTAVGAAAAKPNVRQPAPTLVETVHEAIAPFEDVTAAEAAGYVPMLGCVNGPQEGAMGIHYMNAELIGDGELDPTQPEALLYEQRDGRLQLLGVELLVLAEVWDADHDTPPVLMGQLFNYVGARNRYGNPPFYELHVWTEKPNPRGMFADWNPTVSCEDVSTAE